MLDYSSVFLGELERSAQLRLVDKLLARARLAAIKVVEKIQKTYRNTDKKVQEAHFITRFFVHMRESTCCFMCPELYGVRWLIGEEAERGFRSYSPEAFQNQFKDLDGEIHPEDDHGKIVVWSQDISKVIQKERSILPNMVEAIEFDGKSLSPGDDMGKYNVEIALNNNKSPYFQQ